MSYTTLTAPLTEMPAYRKLIETLAPAGACALAEGCVDSQKQHLIHALSREEALASHARFRLILTYSDRRAREIQQEYSFYDRNVTMYPAKDLIFYQADLRSREIDRERIRCQAGHGGAARDGGDDFCRIDGAAGAARHPAAERAADRPPRQAGALRGR